MWKKVCWTSVSLCLYVKTRRREGSFFDEDGVVSDVSQRQHDMCQPRKEIEFAEIEESKTNTLTTRMQIAQTGRWVVPVSVNGLCSY